MPFTPFHMGPGIAVKAVSGRYFSLMVFGYAQVLMDLEPLAGILRGSDVLHGMTHTYAAALVLGLAAWLTGRPLCAYLLRQWNKTGFTPLPDTISHPAAAIGALTGTLSHVLLDSMMHFDMRPFYPFSPHNGLLYLLSAPSLHILCLLLALSGGTLMLTKWLWKRADRIN